MEIGGFWKEVGERGVLLMMLTGKESDGVLEDFFLKV